MILSFPTSEDVRDFAITDETGNLVEFVLVEKWHEKRDVFSSINLPGVIDVDNYKIYLKVNKMKPMSFMSYKVNAKIGSSIVHFSTFRT